MEKRVKTREDQFGESTYLNEYTEYDEEALRDLCEDLISQIKAARAAGFTKTFVQFASTADPYDPMLGPVEVQIRGERPLNVYEQDEDEKETYIQNLAVKLGCTFYEAGVVDRLQKTGKVKL